MADQTTTEQAGTSVQLQLSDILLAAQIIQLASSRGAFRTEEFTQVGGLYERMVAFLKETGALQPAPQADATTGETTATDTQEPVAE
jgi:hypothetical protein